MKKTGTFFLNRDNLNLGLILGLLTPMLVMVIVFFIWFADQYEFIEFLRTFIRSKQKITLWGVWCLVGNIALFTYYVNTNRDRTAKGIFAISLIYGIGILLLKLMI